MKIRFVIFFLGIFFGSLFADSMIGEDDIIANIALKSNQVLLFDNRTQRAVGIIEVTPNGKILRIPLPKNNKNTLSTSQTKKPESSPTQAVSSPIKDKNLQNAQQDTESIPKPSDKSEERLINKNKQWDKKKIPYLIKEEVIHKD